MLMIFRCLMSGASLLDEKVSDIKVNLLSDAYLLFVGIIGLYGSWKPTDYG